MACARDLTRLLQNNCLKDDEALSVLLPLANAPQLLTQHRHGHYPHFLPWGIIASHYNHIEVLTLVLLDSVIYNPPTEVTTIIGVHPVSVDFLEVGILWCQGVYGKISFQGLRIRPLTGVFIPVL